MTDKSLTYKSFIDPKTQNDIKTAIKKGNIEQLIPKNDQTIQNANPFKEVEPQTPDPNIQPSGSGAVPSKSKANPANIATQYPIIVPDLKDICLISEETDFYSAMVASKKAESQGIVRLTNKEITALIVNPDGSRNDTVCNALIEQFGMRSVWTDIFGYIQPDGRLADWITCKYSDLDIRRLAVPNILANLLYTAGNASLFIMLRPGTEYTIECKGNTTTINYDTKDSKSVFWHYIPNTNNLYHTDLNTGVPSTDGKGCELYLHRGGNCAVGAVIRSFGETNVFPSPSNRSTSLAKCVYLENNFSGVLGKKVQQQS